MTVGGDALVYHSLSCITELMMRARAAARRERAGGGAG
eukprot:SAG31_NODE_1665_length_7585_cov_6.666711_1_plen_37_part_10